MTTSTDLDVFTAGSWQHLLKTAVRDAAELCRRLDLPTEFAAAAVQGARAFPVFAPLGFINRMCPGDPRDPLLRQVLPLRDEAVEIARFCRRPG